MTLSASSLLCLALLHFLWQGAAIAAVAWVMGALARRFSAQAQYVVLVAGLAAMPVAFAATVFWLAQFAAPLSPASLVLVADIAPADQPANPLFLLDGSPPAAADQPVARLADSWQRVSPWLAAVYLLIVAGLSGRVFLGLCGARRLVRESAAMDDERLLAFVAKQCQLLGLRAAPLVAYCRDVAVPTAIGLLRPTILLPLAATTGMTAEEIESILIHELVHIRRRDQLFVLMQRLLEIVFFFHPAVWLLSRRISDVREHCCDDRVISLGIEPEVYVESLLRAAELSLFGPAVKPSSSLAIALSAVDQPSRLRERILRLMDRPAPAPVKLRPGALILAIGIVFVLLAAPVAMQSLAQTPASHPAEKGRRDNSDGGVIRVVGQSNDRKLEPTDVVPGQADRIVQFVQESGPGQVLVVAFDADQSTASQFRGQFGSQFEVRVTGREFGAVWGTDVYTDDSDLGAAAVHAGLVKPGEQAALVLTVVKSPPQHVGSTRNGVTSKDYGPFGGSFMLHRPQSAATGPYTALSAWDFKLSRLVREKVNSSAADIEAAQTDLNEIHRLKTADCRSCHAPSTTVADATAYRGKFGRQFDVEIVGSTEGMIWGTDIYTDDSRIATAAVHAGIVKPNERAIVTVIIVESPEEHAASERNGVKSGTWGSYPSSYVLMRRSTVRKTKTQPASPETAGDFRGKLGRRFDIEVVGRTDGYIWGTDVYTDDSNIATAAVHAGLVKAGERAIVTLTMVESPEQHRGSTRNGVQSRDYGSFPSSYILQRATEESALQKGIRYLQGTSDGASGQPPQPKTTMTEDYSARPETVITRFRKVRTADRSTNALVLRGEFGTQLDVEITGRTTGQVWGTDVYTDDSDIPTAAVHAGLLKPDETGTITVTIVRSPEKYRGSSRHGVSSDAWGGHPSGYLLQRKLEKTKDLSPVPPTPSDETSRRVYY